MLRKQFSFHLIKMHACAMRRGRDDVGPTQHVGTPTDSSRYLLWLHLHHFTVIMCVAEGDFSNNFKKPTSGQPDQQQCQLDHQLQLGFI